MSAPQSVQQMVLNRTDVARARRSGKYQYQRLLKTMKIQSIRYASHKNTNDFDN